MAAVGATGRLSFIVGANSHGYAARLSVCTKVVC